MGSRVIDLIVFVCFGSAMPRHSAADSLNGAYSGFSVEFSDQEFESLDSIERLCIMTLV